MNRKNKLIPDLCCPFFIEDGQENKSISNQKTLPRKMSCWTTNFTLMTAMSRHFIFRFFSALT